MSQTPTEPGYCAQCGHRHAPAAEGLHVQPRPLELRSAATRAAWDALDVIGVPTWGQLLPAHAETIREVMAVLGHWARWAEQEEYL